MYINKSSYLVLQVMNKFTILQSVGFPGKKNIAKFEKG